MQPQGSGEEGPWAEGSRQRGGLAEGSPRAGRRWHRGGQQAVQAEKRKAETRVMLTAGLLLLTNLGVSLPGW